MAENTEKRSRTREKMKAALIALCDRKSYSDITVWDICHAAGVYRSTFYRYYDNKDDVLRELEGEYLQDTQRLTPTLWTLHAGSSPEELAACRRELTADMEYHRAHRQLCKFLLSPAGDLYSYNKIAESIRQAVKKSDTHRSVPAEKTADYLPHLVSTGFLSTVHEWLQREDCSPGEMAEFLLSFVLEPLSKR